MLNHKFTLRETVLVFVAAVLALGIFYYQVVYKNYQSALKQYDTTNVQEQVTVLSAKASKMKHMQDYIDAHEGVASGEVAVYNNLANEIDALAGVFVNASNVSINWQEPYLTDNIVRRNADITVQVPSYSEAESIVNGIANLKYRCVISTLSINGGNTDSVDTSNNVSVSMSVTFFETTDGADNTNGLIMEDDTSSN